jgi:hypothetical protein
MLKRDLLAVLMVTALVSCERSSPPATDTNPSSSTGQSSETDSSSDTGPAIEIVDQVAEIACGECQFEMKGFSCDLAVRIDGNSYFVDGFTVDDFGDAHAADGLCNAVKQARVAGRIEGGRFIATAIEVLPE